MTLQLATQTYINGLNVAAFSTLSNSLQARTSQWFQQNVLVGFNWASDGMSFGTNRVMTRTDVLRYAGLRGLSLWNMSWCDTEWLGGIPVYSIQVNGTLQTGDSVRIRRGTTVLHAGGLPATIGGVFGNNNLTFEVYRTNFTSNQSRIYTINLPNPCP